MKDIARHLALIKRKRPQCIFMLLRHTSEKTRPKEVNRIIATLSE